ncbi:MAG: GAF domain-containing protein [Anaerolineaceae bacterium]|nr:GAF domain-containing protein [Anaerolineaceae bacterium]
MVYWKRLLPQNTPDSVASLSRLTILREQIFQTGSLFAAGAGSLAYIGLLIDDFQRNNWSNFPVATLLMFIIWLVTLARLAPYYLRAATLMLGIYVLGTWALLQSGLEANALLILFAFSVLSALFFNVQLSIAALALTLGTFVFMGILWCNGINPAGATGLYAYSTDPHNWWIAGLLFFFLVSLVAVSISVLLNEQGKAMQRQDQLRSALEAERATLEQRIHQRTGDIERRLVQIQTAADISRAIASILDPQQLLQEVVDLLQSRTDLYYVGLFIKDETGKNAILRAGSGQAGQHMIVEGHHLVIGGSSMIGWSIQNKKARIALQAEQDSIRFRNPHLPETRSELAIPILSHQEALGALSIQSVEPDAFDSYDIIIFQSVADSLSTALENAQLFRQSQEDLEEIQALNRQYTQQAWEDLVNESGELQYSLSAPTQPDQEDGASLHLPITLREQVIGFIDVESGQAEFDEKDLESLEAILAQTAVALENARLIKETQQHAIQMDRVNSVTSAFTKAVTIEDILKSALSELGEMPAINEISVRLAPQITPDVPLQPPAAGKSRHDNGSGPAEVKA